MRVLGRNKFDIASVRAQKDIVFDLGYRKMSKISLIKIVETQNKDPNYVS